MTMFMARRELRPSYLHAKRQTNQFRALAEVSLFVEAVEMPTN